MTPLSYQRVSRAEVLLFVTICLWAANYAVAKFALGRLDFLLFNGMRYLVAAAALGIALPHLSRWSPIKREDRREFLRAGVVSNVLAQVAFMAGLSLTSAGNAAVLLATSPLWTTLISSRLHRERIRLQMVIGMVVSLLGVVLIIVGTGKEITVDARALYGDLICVVAAALWALGTNLQKPLVGSYSPYQVTTVLVSIGAVGLSILAGPSVLSTDWTTVTWPYFGAVVGSGIVSMAAGSVVWAAGVKHLGPSRTSNFSNLLPVLALGISSITLGERVVPMQLIGSAITIAGVWYARRHSTVLRDVV